jgi:HlyD family secretion protein
MRVFKTAATIILCAVLLVAAGCSSKTTTTIKTQTATAQKGSISVTVTGTGNLALSRTENLAFEIPGTVEEVLVETGDTVQAGQVLARLDTSAWDTQMTAYKNAVITAERKVTVAQKQLRDDQIAVTKALDDATSAQYAFTQAGYDVQTANDTLNDITEVKKIQDEIDNANDAIKLARNMLTGVVGGGANIDSSYWYQVETNARTALADSNQKMKELLAGTSLTVSSDVTLDVLKKSLAVEKAQLAINQAQTSLQKADNVLKDAQDTISLDEQDIQVALDNLKTAQKNLDDARKKSPEITAPFDGFISNVNVEGGDEVLKGTIAVTIADPDQFSAKILVTEDDISSVKLEGEATVSITALSDLSFPAEVIKISPTATVSSGVVNYSVTVNITSLQPVAASQSSMNQMPVLSGNRTTQSGMLPVRSGNMTIISGAPPAGLFQGGSGNFTMPAFSQTNVQVNSAANVTLKDGLSAVVEIISQQKSNIVTVPSKAITTKNQLSTVQVVTSTGTETRMVTTGITDGSYTEITEGLNEGETVVLKGSSSSSSSTNTQQGMPSFGIGGGPSGGPPPGGF